MDDVDDALWIASRSVGELRSLANRLAWRNAMAARTRAVGAVLRALTPATSGLRRERDDAGWRVVAPDGRVVAVLESRTRARTLDLVRRPMVVKLADAAVPTSLRVRLAALGAVVAGERGEPHG